jgi:hypothetical protein
MAVSATQTYSVLVEFKKEKEGKKEGIYRDTFAILDVFF